MDRAMGKGAGDIVDKVTLNIGTIKGGVKVNMVPSSATFEADIRLPLGVTRERVLAEVEKILKDFPDATVKETNCNLPSWVDPDCDIIEIVQSTVEELRGFRPTPIVSLGGTDARLWRYRNIPTCVYGPFPHGMGSHRRARRRRGIPAHRAHARARILRLHVALRSQPGAACPCRWATAVDALVDLSALEAGPEDDIADQGVDRFGRSRAAVRVIQHFREGRDLGSVDVGDVGMHVWQVGGSLRHALGDLRLAPFQLLYARLHGRLMRPPGNPHAYDCYLRGLPVCLPVSIESLGQALRLFTEVSVLGGGPAISPFVSKRL